jgi:peptide/nickel transport system substrate-binding protein
LQIPKSPRSNYTRFAQLGAVVSALVALVAGCGGSKATSPSPTTTGSGSVVGSGTYDNGAPARGGVYRVGWEDSFGFTDNFDPTGEYLLGSAWGIYTNLMLRPLIGYKHLPGTAGDTPVGDLATGVPKPTDDGLTYTYTLRKGVKFGPPIGRVVTSKDVAYALTRLANPNDGGQYSFYYTVIRGWDAYAAGKARTISGIDASSPSKLVIHLVKATGDFNRRMSMPATAPIPPEIGACFEGKPGDYGRDIVSTGPYMLQGARGVSLPCASLQPMSGYDGANGNHIVLLRNPDYRQSTDPYRKNYPDKFTFTVVSNADDIYAKVQSGALDDEVASPSPETIRQYESDATLKPRLIPNAGDQTNYLTMNLTQPPFDDVHVRKAMNWITDKAALQEAWGGAIAGSIATHIVPPNLYNGGLAKYDPYPTSDQAGDLAQAQAQMRLSKYDPSRSGKCTASGCKNVLLVSDTRAVDTRMLPIVKADAAKLGITFKVRSIEGAYSMIQDPSQNVAFSTRTSWGKDYSDPYTFFGELFDSAAIIPSGNTNYSLVGLTPAIAAKVKSTGAIASVPSVDPDIHACQVKLAQARTTCWESLDRKLMTQIVPLVPYLWTNNVFIVGPNVTHWNYDQFSAGPAYASVAVSR